MPWKETCVMDERIKFIGRLLGGEKMAPLCREFEISRVTGHKIWRRYQECGNAGLQNRSRAPHTHPNAVSSEVVKVQQQVTVTVLEKDLDRKRISLSLLDGKKKKAPGNTPKKKQSAASKGRPAPGRKKANPRQPKPFNNPMADALAKLRKG